MNDNLNKLQRFFAIDVNIKKEMYNNCPPSNKGYLDNNSIIKYANDLNESLIYIFNELKVITASLFGTESVFFQKVVYLEKNIKNKFYACGTDIDKLRIFYNNYVSSMKTDFIDSVKEECVGYKVVDDFTSINMVRSINEMLHLIHSYLINNENILEEIPLIGQRINDFSYQIMLRGKNVPLFNQLFFNFPNDLDCGDTDIVVVNENKALMMVRDRGHALTIEVTIKDEIARIEYFIPKLCNIEMINNLPGINKVNKDSVGATGAIEVKVADLEKMLFNFIANVPMDSDMVLEDNNTFIR